MKELVLNPEDCLYSHETDKYKLERLEEAVRDGKWESLRPIYVVASKRIPGKFLPYNGNNRVHTAKWFDKQLKSVLIESDEDIAMINAIGNKHSDGYASWDCYTERDWYVKPENLESKSEYETLVLRIEDWAFNRPGIPEEQIQWLCELGVL